MDRSVRCVPFKSPVRRGLHVGFALGQRDNRLNMPWDNNVNKKAHIYAVAATIDVKNMPLISWVRTPGSISLSRQTGFCHIDLIKPFSQKASKVFATPLCSVIFPSTILSIFTPLISMVLLVGVIPKNSPL